MFGVDKLIKGGNMNFPQNEATNLTERIMFKIRGHLIKEPPPQENHHYNRVYEKIYAVLNEVSKPLTEGDPR